MVLACAGSDHPRSVVGALRQGGNVVICAVKTHRQVTPPSWPSRLPAARCEVNTPGGANQSPGRPNTSNLAPVPVFFSGNLWGAALRETKQSHPSNCRSNRPLQAPCDVQHVMKYGSPQLFFFFCSSRGTDEHRRSHLSTSSWTTASATRSHHSLCAWCDLYFFSPKVAQLYPSSHKCALSPRHR